MNRRRGLHAAFFAAGTAMAIGGGMAAEANVESAGNNLSTAFAEMGTEEGQEANNDYRHDVAEVIIDGIIAVTGTGIALVSVGREVQATLYDRHAARVNTTEELMPEAA